MINIELQIMESVYFVNCNKHIKFLKASSTSPPSPVQIYMTLVLTEENSEDYTVKKKACNAHQIWYATFVPSGTPYMASSNAKFLVCVLRQIGCAFTPAQCAFLLTSVFFPLPLAYFHTNSVCFPTNFSVFSHSL